MVSPDVNVGRGLSLIGIPLGSASVSRVFTRRSETREQRLRSSSAINTNLELRFAEANNPFKNDRNVATVCVLLQHFAPFPQQTAAGWRDFTAWRGGK